MFKPVMLTRQSLYHLIYNSRKTAENLYFAILPVLS